MFFPEQDQFYRRWLEKADSVAGDDVIPLIDRFITLFINYNALYNMVPLKMAMLNNQAIEVVRDHRGATTYMTDFLTVPVISDYLTQERLGPVVIDLANAIETFDFHINLQDRVRHPDTDRNLVSGLRSTRPKPKVTALLETLYQIRCNIFHGEKALAEYQAHLLRPATRLLRALVVLSAREIARLPV